MTTVSANNTLGIVLSSSSYTNPVIVDPGVTISGNGGGIAATTGTWSIQNAGNVAATGTSGAGGFGVNLHDGGSVTNAASGSITGGYSAIYIGATGTVANYGNIAGVAVSGGAFFFNFGVDINLGGVVTNGTSASIAGLTNGVEVGTGGKVVNDGSIAGGGGGGGVALPSGGSVTNAVSGSITGGLGVVIGGGAGTVANDGHVTGLTSAVAGGVDLTSGGSVSNSASGYIAGGIGVAISGGLGTVINQGTIAGMGTVVANGIGVSLPSGGSVTNAEAALIMGTMLGLSLRSGGTVTNAGSIIGSGGTAIAFGGTGNNLLMLDPGDGFSGVVIGGTSASNTLELASAASAGMLSGLGSQYINFTQTTIDIGATWTLTGTNSLGAGATIANYGSLKLFGASLTDYGLLTGPGITNIDPSTLIVNDVSGGGTIEVGSSSTLTVHGTVAAGETIAFAGTNAVLNILHAGSFAGTITGQGPTDQINIACFATGTHLLTTCGEMAVDELEVGDLVVTRLGQLRPVLWIGHRDIDCRRHPHPQGVQPVRVCADAFANRMPHRDLFLSPDHAVFIDGVLIPIRYLINGATIVQEHVDDVTYFHVELSSHDVILAESLPCETYLDTGNRGAFANGGKSIQMHPDFALKVWETKACAELVVNGPKLTAAKSIVLSQAEALGYRVTNDPSLGVIVDSHTLLPTITGKTWRVGLPPDVQTVRLVSRSWVPASVLTDNDDTRSLGVAIANVCLDGRTLALDDHRYCSGWHAAEPDWRWTDGDAGLTLAGVRELVFDVVMTGSYWEAAEELDKVRAG